MILQFLDAVYGETKGYTSVWWRETPGPKSPIDKQKWFRYPQQRDQMVQFIDQKRSHDVYIPVAMYDEERVKAGLQPDENGKKIGGRIPEHATVVQSLWNDTDTFDPTEYRVKPSVVVKTSEGRTHCWWILDKPVDAIRAELVVKKITYAHKGEGADISSWGRNKLLRVPGTYNSSHGFPEEVTAEYTGAVYTLEEIANAYDDVPLPAASPARLSVSTPADPVDVPDTLPDFFDAQAKLPQDFPIELLSAEPSVGDGGNRSEMRWRLIAELVEAGLTDAEVFVIAKQSKAAQKWEEDPRGWDGLWAEVAKERQKYEWGSVPDAEPAKPKQRNSKRVELLTPEERELAKAHLKKSWIAEYEDWVRSRVKIFNAPYHRAAAWMSLSQLVGENARLNIGGNDVPLGLYFFVLGGTTTGKSQAKSFMRRTVHNAYYSSTTNPDCGDDVSIQALLDVLRNRPRGVGMMSSDEVDGTLNKMREKGSWRAGDLAVYTDLYDGTVAPLIRKGQTEGTWTKVQFSWYGMGTEVKVVDALDRSMFESGFLARFQWFIGSNIEVDENDLGVRLGGSDSYKEQMAEVDKWQARFQLVKEQWGVRTMGLRDTEYGIIEPNDEDTVLYVQQATAKMEKRLWAGDANYDILRPSLTRHAIAAVKMAALLAIADGRFTFTKLDVMAALYQCEQILPNLYHVAGLVSASDHSKMLTALYDYVLAHGQDVKSGLIFRHMSDKLGLSVLDVERIRDELRAQGRLSFVKDGLPHAWVATAIEPKGEES